jgi:hypothetical protein
VLQVFRNVLVPDESEERPVRQLGFLSAAGKQEQSYSGYASSTNPTPLAGCKRGNGLLHFGVDCTAYSVDILHFAFLLRRAAAIRFRDEEFEARVAAT